MIVSVSGFNYSGSSAVVDLLKEYENVQCVEDEIGFPYLPDGITDLEYHINESSTYFNGDVGIRRYYHMCKKSDIPRQYRKRFLDLTKEYLDRLTDTTWKGNSYFDGSRKEGINYASWKVKRMISAVVYHYTKKAILFDQRTMYLAYDNSSFKKHTRWYFQEIEKLFSEGKQFVVFNQFFSAFQPERSMRLSDNAKTIVVDRDPRDIYILGKIRHENSCYPVDDVKKYVIWYKKCHKEKQGADTDKVLFVQFEDLIFKYDETVKNIERFLGLENHVDKKKRFKPEVSKNNTQLIERFPQLKNDINYIIANLPQNLYSFPVDYTIEGDFF